MKYNLYYKNQRINSKPIDDADLKEMLKDKTHITKIYNTRNIQKIPINQLRLVECHIV